VSREVYDFAVTIPAGTAKSAGFTSALAMPPRTVTQIDVRVPPGPNGAMSFGIGAAGSTVLPHGGPAYFTMSDQYREFPLEEQITSGAWVLFGYNTGVFDHTVYVTFHCELPYDDGSSGSTGTVPIGDLGPGGGTTGTDTGGTTPPAEPPPVIAPPTIPPPVIGAPGGTSPPLVLPPALPALPGQGPAGPPAEVDQLLIGAGTSGTVWLVSDGGYSQIADQDSLNALTASGVPSAQLSDAAHGALLAAAFHQVTVTLGSETLTGTLLPPAPPVTGH